MYKFIDLFCGIGGFRKALESKNLECIFSSDIDKDVQEAYKKILVINHMVTLLKYQQIKFLNMIYYVLVSLVNLLVFQAKGLG